MCIRFIDRLSLFHAYKAVSLLVILFLLFPKSARSLSTKFHFYFYFLYSALCFFSLIFELLNVDNNIISLHNRFLNSFTYFFLFLSNEPHNIKLYLCLGLQHYLSSALISTPKEGTIRFEHWALYCVYVYV